MKYRSGPKFKSIPISVEVRYRSAKFKSIQFYVEVFYRSGPKFKYIFQFYIKVKYRSGPKFKLFHFYAEVNIEVSKVLIFTVLYRGEI